MFNFFKRKNENIDWELIKTQENIYPKHSISLLMGETESGKPTTGWVDLGYKAYKFKNECPNNLTLTIDIVNENESLDMEYIEDTITDNLRKTCVAHPISRVTTDSGLVMDYYVDNLKMAQNELNNISKIEIANFKLDVKPNLDPRWRTYKSIVKAVS